MADSIRGDGLFRADRALEALVQSPGWLARVRARFSASPPSYHSQPSGTTTRSQSPDQRGEAQQRRDQQKSQLEVEHRASLPYHQFKAQYSEELARLFEADRNQAYQCPPSLNSIYEHEDANVRMRWLEQGIWRDEWNSEYRPGGQWKHEDPLPPEDETGSDAVLPEREASRLYYQFIFQVSEERERIQEEMASPRRPRRIRMNQAVVRRNRLPPSQAEADGRPVRERSFDGGAAASTPPDINTTAYERVKGAWVKRQIWDEKWGVLPGMSRKHEQPFEEMLREELGEDPGAATRGVRETNVDETHGMLPPLHLFEPDQPSEASQRTGPRWLNPSAQEARPVESPALKPVRPTKISKTRKPGPPALSRQLQPAKAPAEAGPPTEPDAAELVHRAANTPPVRRSRRLHATEDNRPAKPDGTTDQRNGVRRSTRRASAGAGAPKFAAAKPEGGIIKRRARNSNPAGGRGG